jgi:nitrogen-specific signal transduction histidine kinase
MSATDLARMIFEIDRLRELVDKLEHEKNALQAKHDELESKLTITPAMIEAGAQRLVSWEDGCIWPDSWSGLQVAAARNDAERVLRSALNGDKK